MLRGEKVPLAQRIYYIFSIICRTTVGEIRKFGLKRDMTLLTITGLYALSPWMAAILGLVLGLVIGSYLATIFWRWPMGESANRGRSRCDNCDRQLVWHELIPIIGVIISKGHCRSCGARIGWQHSLIELSCGILGAICFAAGTPWLAPMAWLLVLLAVFDWRYLWLPNSLVAVSAILALAVPPFETQTVGQRIIGGTIAFGILWTVAAFYRRFRGRDGLGGGDAKLFGAIGLWVGPLNLPLVLLVSTVMGLADVLARMARGSSTATMKLPLGTYMAVTTIGLIVMYPVRAVFGFET